MFLAIFFQIAVSDEYSEIRYDEDEDEIAIPFILYVCVCMYCVLHVVLY